MPWNGGHLTFQIHSKNIHVVKDHPRHIPPKFAVNDFVVSDKDNF
jgi:hypothetical protein